MVASDAVPGPSADVRVSVVAGSVSRMTAMVVSQAPYQWKMFRAFTPRSGETMGLVGLMNPKYIALQPPPFCTHTIRSESLRDKPRVRMVFAMFSVFVVPFAF